MEKSSVFLPIRVNFMLYKDNQLCHLLHDLNHSVGYAKV
jgi:hypothetical protein